MTSVSNSGLSALEQILGQNAIPAVWQRRTGDDFERFKLLCLQPAPMLVQSVPCVIGCSFRVDHQADKSIIGICKRKPPLCRDIVLTEADIIPLQLSWSRLGRAICAAFGLDSKSTNLQIPYTIQVGSWSADAVPVILTIQTERRDFWFVVSDLIVRLNQRFILLAPTSKHCDAHVQARLAKAGAE